MICDDPRWSRVLCWSLPLWCKAPSCDTRISGIWLGTRCCHLRAGQEGIICKSVSWHHGLWMPRPGVPGLSLCDFMVLTRPLIMPGCLAGAHSVHWLEGVWRQWDPGEAERKGRSAKVARVCLPAILICLGLKPQQKGQWPLKPCPGLAQQCVPNPVSTMAVCLVKHSSLMESERTPTKWQFVQWCVLLHVLLLMGVKDQSGPVFVLQTAFRNHAVKGKVCKMCKIWYIL